MNMPSLKITFADQSQLKTLPKDFSKVPFGSQFTDHMFVMEWTESEGWMSAEIRPYEGFVTDPACVGLHYGPSIFEGMKAFRTVDDRLALFRPDEHLLRFNRSASRMCMPEIDTGFVLKALKKLIECDQRWISREPGTSLYIRPIMIATETTLGLKRAQRFLFFIILSPAGSFYQGGFNPISIMVSEHFTRASVGGVGNVKTAGNYAASVMAQEEAKKQGYAQVLWLDPIERLYVEEVGSMNIFFVMDNQLETPALTGTILPGITRKSIIELGRLLDIPVLERRLSIDEVVKGITDGSLSEVFGTGTAVGISPVGKLAYQGKTYVINNNETGPVTHKLYSELSGVQRGKMAGFGWLDYVI
jgi:branched-chain amino acid aminotransferase